VTQPFTVTGQGTPRTRFDKFLAVNDNSGLGDRRVDRLGTVVDQSELNAKVFCLAQLGSIAPREQSSQLAHHAYLMKTRGKSPRPTLAANQDALSVI
jgi:hypothetical protein